MNKDILICGVGGQGTVMISKIIAAAAMKEGNRVHSAETIGMAQRGGPVTSHVRVGDEAFSPLVPFGSADVLIAFEPAEAVRNLRYLKPDGAAVVNTGAVKPVTESLLETGYDGREMIEYLRGKCNAIFVDAGLESSKAGSEKFFNVVILGTAAGTGYLGIDKDTILAQIDDLLEGRGALAKANREAFLIGYEIGKQSADERGQK